PSLPASLEDDFCGWIFVVTDFPPWLPLPVFQMLCLHAKRSVGEQFTGRADFPHAAGAARHHLVRDQFPILEAHAAHGHEAGCREVVIGHLPLLFIPPEGGLTAVGPVIYRMQNADGFT